MADKKKIESPTFEENLEALRFVVSKMESGDMPLDEALALYEDGIKRADAMGRQLKKAAGRVTLLEKKRGTFEESPFEEVGSDE